MDCVGLGLGVIESKSQTVCGCSSPADNETEQTITKRSPEMMVFMSNLRIGNLDSRPETESEGIFANFRVIP